jgi:hypothetical protein
VRIDEDKARTVANIVVGAAALGAAVVILRTPALRRLAFGLARTALTVTIPAWLAKEVQGAWADAGRPASGTVAPDTGRSAQLL